MQKTKHSVIRQLSLCIIIVPFLCFAKTKEKPIIKAIEIDELLLFSSNSLEFENHSMYLDSNVINELSLNNSKKSEYIFAWNTRVHQWEFYIPIYIIVFNPKIEKDVQDIYVKTMKKSDTGIMLVNSKCDTFYVDLEKQLIKPQIKVYEMH